MNRIEKIGLEILLTAGFFFLGGSIGTAIVSSSGTSTSFDTFFLSLFILGAIALALGLSVALFGTTKRSDDKK
jgi:hypothetical protein